MSLNSLTKRYEQECERRELPKMCARELEYELIISLQGETSRIPDTMTDEQKRDHLSWAKRFNEVWERWEAHERTMQILCIEALKHGYGFHWVHDGEETTRTNGCSVAEVIELAGAVDEAWIAFKGRDSGTVIRFFLIFDLQPDELIADHSAHPDADLIYQAVAKRI